MEISDVSPSLSRAEQEAERTVLVLRKQRDVQQAQADAVIELLRQANPDGTGRIVNVRV